MAHELSYLEDDGIIFTKYLMPWALEEFGQVVAENLAMAAETGSLLFLGDCRELPSSGSLIDIYEMGEMLDGLGVDRRMREALVVAAPAEETGTFEFFVTVTTNRGIQVRLFGDMDEATEWLRVEGARLSDAASESGLEADVP
jgi:hypothetical protein